ncbi:hypothetical protein B0H15DRAFT_806585 [Mycena belliarum]|uniref:Uncharacterized protein n=1 Tax=Mycena belliarum TaxID=1033014 RepID=A0AAD6TNA0_9AGAR|nr:hypothetical protein B0H15DRAFT_806585 [Mycena belliae]
MVPSNRGFECKWQEQWKSHLGNAADKLRCSERGTCGAGSWWRNPEPHAQTGCAFAGGIARAARGMLCKARLGRILLVDKVATERAGLKTAGRGGGRDHTNRIGGSAFPQLPSLCMLDKAGREAMARRYGGGTRASGGLSGLHLTRVRGSQLRWATFRASLHSTTRTRGAGGDLRRQHILRRTSWDRGNITALKPAHDGLGAFLRQGHAAGCAQGWLCDDCAARWVGRRRCSWHTYTYWTMRRARREIDVFGRNLGQEGVTAVWKSERTGLELAAGHGNTEQEHVHLLPTGAARSGAGGVRGACRRWASATTIALRNVGLCCGLADEGERGSVHCDDCAGLTTVVYTGQTASAAKNRAVSMTRSRMRSVCHGATSRRGASSIPACKFVGGAAGASWGANGRGGLESGGRECTSVNHDGETRAMSYLLPSLHACLGSGLQKTRGAYVLLQEQLYFVAHASLSDVAR